MLNRFLQPLKTYHLIEAYLSRNDAKCYIKKIIPALVRFHKTIELDQYQFKAYSSRGIFKGHLFDVQELLMIIQRLLKCIPIIQ
jgi:hypothetical protein